MSDIYYSKRSGVETERILDKANSIKINEQPTENITLNTIKIGDTKYKPKIVKKKTVYIHIVELFFSFDIHSAGQLKTLITIDDKSTPYVEGNEYLFFKSFGGGAYLSQFTYGQDILTGSYFCTGVPEFPKNVNGHFASYYNSTYYGIFSWFSAKARINEDKIYKLEVEEL